MPDKTGFRELLQMTAEERGQEESLLSLAAASSLIRLQLRYLDCYIICKSQKHNSKLLLGHVLEQFTNNDCWLHWSTCPLTLKLCLTLTLTLTQVQFNYVYYGVRQTRPHTHTYTHTQYVIKMWCVFPQTNRWSKSKHLEQSLWTISLLSFPCLHVSYFKWFYRTHTATFLIKKRS